MERETELIILELRPNDRLCVTLEKPVLSSSPVETSESAQFPSCPRWVWSEESAGLSRGSTRIAKAAPNSTSIARAFGVLPPEHDASFGTHANYKTFWPRSSPGTSLLYLIFLKTGGAT